MPESFNITDSIVTPAFKESAYKVKTGREIYEEISLTGINRAVIDSLGAFVVGESHVETSGASLWPEIPPEDLVNAFLVDGSFAMRVVAEEEMQKNEKLDEPYQFLEDCIEIHRRLVTQALRDKESDQPNGLTRVWQQTNKDWVVRDVENYGEKNERIISTTRYPLDAFYPYPNGLGILYWNQYTYRRIEEIEDSIRKQTGKAALSLILTGYLGDITQARTAFESGGEVIHLPGNPTVTRVASTDTVNQLISSGDKLMRLFLKNTHQIEISETSDMSGVSRRLAMTPMLHFIKLVQTQLGKIYEDIGYTASFLGLNVTTPEERIAELDFFKRGFDEGHIYEDEYRNMARALYGLTGPPPPLKEPEPEPEPVEMDNSMPPEEAVA